MVLSLAETMRAQTSSSRDAVGTALSGGPPHRSQRAELPHWAPGSGPASDWAKPSPAHTIQRMCDAPIPALCPGRVLLTVFPSPSPLSSTTSATALAALFGGFAGTMGL